MRVEKDFKEAFCLNNLNVRNIKQEQRDKTNFKNAQIKFYSESDTDSKSVPNEFSPKSFQNTLKHATPSSSDKPLNNPVNLDLVALKLSQIQEDENEEQTLSPVGGNSSSIPLESENSLYNRSYAASPSTGNPSPIPFESVQ